MTTPWVPSKEWDGGDAYIIGGGPSLSTFPWGYLRGKNTIACNSAFVPLGADIVKYVVFGDWQWWLNIGKQHLPEFGGIVVGCPVFPSKRATLPDWILHMGREETKNGLAAHGAGTLGWNGHTGSLAINLALLLGAHRVYLLGFDMKASPEGHANWHDVRFEGTPDQSVYNLYKIQFSAIVRDVKGDAKTPSMFPGCELINVTDDSTLELLPKVSIRDHFVRVKEKV